MQTSTRWWWLPVVLALGPGDPTPVLAQVPVGGCGVVVPARQTGTVLNDITCSPGSFVVMLEDRATLDLAGYTLTGGEVAVRCARRCTVMSTGGPGTIANARIGIGGTTHPRTSITVYDVNLDGHEQAITSAPTALPPGSYGVPRGRVRGARVAIDGSSFVGVSSGGSMRLSDCVVSGGATYGLQGSNVKLDRCSVTGNGAVGVESLSLRLKDSTVTGNGASFDGIDVATLKRPKLLDSTCGRSQQFQSPAQNWGVCTND